MSELQLKHPFPESLKEHHQHRQAGGDTKRNTTMLLQREARPRRDRQTLQGVYSAGNLAAEEVAHALHLLALRADK